MQNIEFIVADKKLLKIANYNNEKEIVIPDGITEICDSVFFKLDKCYIHKIAKYNYKN